MGLLNPADMHQVIHVKGSGAPHPIPHFPSKAKELAAGLSAQDPQAPRGDHWLGFPRAAFPGPGGPAHEAGIRRALRGPPPLRTGGAPSLDAAARLPRLSIASASPGPRRDSRRNLSAKPRKHQGQVRSRPRVCRSAGPRRRKVGTRGEREARGGRGGPVGAG